MPNPAVAPADLETMEMMEFKFRPREFPEESFIDN